MGVSFILNSMGLCFGSFPHGTNCSVYNQKRIVLCVHHASPSVILPFPFRRKDTLWVDVVEVTCWFGRSIHKTTLVDASTARMPKILDQLRKHPPPLPHPPSQQQSNPPPLHSSPRSPLPSHSTLSLPPSSVQPISTSLRPTSATSASPCAHDASQRNNSPATSRRRPARRQTAGRCAQTTSRAPRASGLAAAACGAGSGVILDARVRVRAGLVEEEEVARGWGWGWKMWFGCVGGRGRGGRRRRGLNGGEGVGGGRRS